MQGLPRHAPREDASPKGRKVRASHIGFWFTLFLFVGTTVVSALLQKRPKDASPASNGEFQVPTAEEGRAIPVAFGTCQLKGPNVVWWGDLKIDPIKKKSGGFLGIGAKKVTVGYKYSVGMMLALCHGAVDELISIMVGDKDTGAAIVPVGSPENYREATIDKPDLFGGDEKEGGIKGVARFYRGLTTQASDSYLTSKFGATAPAYRGLCYCVLPQVYVGTTQYIKNWSFVVRRCPTPSGFDAAKADIAGDANPVHMIFEAMTDPDYGLGIPAGRFNLATWTAAASTIFTEGLGMSILLDADTTADQFIAEVLKTIDGVLYTDPATGLWTIKLARADYDPATLTEFTVDDLVDAPEWSRGLWSETVNEIKVEYTDRNANFQTRVAQVQETANYAVQGVTASETMQFRGVSTMANALKLAMREIKTHSYPLAQFRLKVNRKAWALRPGSPFKLTWAPPSGTAFSGMVLRVTSIRYGALESGEIEIEAVEDVFGVSATAYPDPGGSTWTDPITAPSPVSAQALFEVPYHFVGEERWAMAMAARGDGTTFAAEIWVDEGAGYTPGNELTNLTPSGVLAADYSAKTAGLDSAGFTLAAGGKDLLRLLDEATDANGRNRGDNLAVFADTGEIVSWTTPTDNGDGTFTFSGVLRGVLDTVPTDHAAGTRVWFLSEGAATTKESAYPVDQTVKAKILPKNPRGTVALASAAEMTLATSSRAWKPYPAGNVKLNALGYGSWPSTIIGDAALTWSHRNRVSQGIGGLMVAQDTAGAYALEGNYTIEVLVGGVVKQNFPALTGTSQTYTAAQRVADDSDGTKAVQMRISPKNGSYTGTIRTTPPVVMTGLGMTLGQYLGGEQG